MSDDGSGAVTSVQSLRPLVFLHGFASRTDIWRGAERLSLEEGLQPVLVDWAPGLGQDARTTATDVLLPAIDAELTRLGYREGAPFDVVAHSMSGLLMRYLLEEARPELDRRIGSLVMISTPHRGARTGVANFACALWTEPWRALGCELRPSSGLVVELGAARPEGLDTRYLSVGVESFEPFVPIPAFDGDGDGTALGHDKAVMAESAMLDGAPFVVWRAWGRLGDHFGVTCAEEINRWILDFIKGGDAPTVGRERIHAANLCHGLSKKEWRQSREAAAGGEG